MPQFAFEVTTPTQQRWTLSRTAESFDEAHASMCEEMNETFPRACWSLKGIKVDGQPLSLEEAFPEDP